MQYKGVAFYLRKRINGNVYTRSLKTDVFSVARERIPKKVREILDEITTAAKADASPKTDAPPPPAGNGRGWNLCSHQRGKWSETVGLAGFTWVWKSVNHGA
jgi:hypothetical protein